MKAKSALFSLLALLVLTGCQVGQGEASDEEEGEERSGTSGRVVSHNQGAACLQCHGVDGASGDDEDEWFTSGGTVYTVLNGSTSETYADGYRIRLVLQYTGETISYSSGRGTGNSHTTYANSLNGYTAQVIDANGQVVNASMENSHDVTRLDCNRCHTAAGSDGAPGRIVSYDVYSSTTSSTDTTTGTTVPSSTIVFETDVMAVLENSCKVCHGNSGSLSITDAATTYNVIMANGLVDTLNVESSLLLTKGSGVSHGGGMVIAPTSTQYQTLRDWIAQGAQAGTVTTTPPPTTTLPTVVSFTTHVMPVLQARCQGCHGSSGNFSVTDSASTYNNIMVNGFVDTANPTGSLLLTKANGVVHGGGTVLGTTSTEYVTLQEWIAQGALQN